MTSKVRNINKHAFNKQMALPLTFKTFKNRENFIISECNEKAVKFRPKCYFYPELPAQNTVEAGTGENWRSYCARHLLDEAGIRGNPSFFMRRGRPRVYVSQKYHNEQLRKNKLIKEVKGTLEDYFTK